MLNYSMVFICDFGKEQFLTAIWRISTGGLGDSR
jgi:hypothetical protein